MKSTAFIKVPLIQDFPKPLDYRDILTYTTIRFYINNLSGECYPSLETIATKSGLSYGFINESITRLEESGLITKTPGHVKRSNRYSFKELEIFSMIPADLLELQNLTPAEKGFLISIRQFFLDTLETFDSFTKMATSLRIPYRTFMRFISDLKEKGFIETRNKKINSLVGFNWTTNH